jgi:hypothetical protein
VKLRISHATFQNFPFVVLVSRLNISLSKQYLILCVCTGEREERQRETEKERKIDSGPFGACRFSCRICGGCRRCGLSFLGSRWRSMSWIAHTALWKRSLVMVSTLPPVRLEHMSMKEGGVGQQKQTPDIYTYIYIYIYISGMLRVMSCHAGRLSCNQPSCRVMSCSRRNISYNVMSCNR